MSLFKAIASTALKRLGAKGVVGLLNLDELANETHEKVQDYTPISGTRMTPLQVISAVSQHTLGSVSKAVSNLIPGQIFDDFVSTTFDIPNAAIQFGARILDPLADKWGTKIGERIGSRLQGKGDSLNSKGSKGTSVRNIINKTYNYVPPTHTQDLNSPASGIKKFYNFDNFGQPTVRNDGLNYSSAAEQKAASENDPYKGGNKNG